MFVLSKKTIVTYPLYRLLREENGCCLTEPVGVEAPSPWGTSSGPPNGWGNHQNLL